MKTASNEIVCSVIIPAHNEVEGLDCVLRKVLGVVDESFQVIVVDDGSTDGTAAVAARSPCLLLLRHEKRLGKGRALRTGIDRARGRNVIWIDADDTYPAEGLQEINKALEGGCDLVHGVRSRGRENMPLLNRFGNALFARAIGLLYGGKMADPLSGLCGLRREHLESMDLTSAGFGIDCEVSVKAARMGLRLLDLPVEYRPRLGRAKLRGPTAGVAIGLEILRLLWWRPRPRTTGEMSAEPAVSDPFCESGKRPTVTALICTLNEEENLPHVLPRLPAWIDEVLIVDGHSSDRTVERALELRPDARIIYQPGKGKGDALRYGIQEARHDIVVTLDADGSMDMAETASFVRPLLEGYDFVKGSRFLPDGGTSDMPSFRRFGNWVFTSLVNLFFKAKYTDLCYGYNAFWRKALDGVELRSNGFDVETELNIKVWQKGLRVTEVPSHEQARRFGKGKLSSYKDGAKILRTIFVERLRRHGREDVLSWRRS